MLILFLYPPSQFFWLIQIPHHIASYPCLILLLYPAVSLFCYYCAYATKSFCLLFLSHHSALSSSFSIMHYLLVSLSCLILLPHHLASSFSYHILLPYLPASSSAASSGIILMLQLLFSFSCIILCHHPHALSSYLILFSRLHDYTASFSCLFL